MQSGGKIHLTAIAFRVGALAIGRPDGGARYSGVTRVRSTGCPAVGQNKPRLLVL